MRPNPLRELLKAGKPSVGTHLMSTWPGIVEIAGRVGTIDYVEFVAEYAPYDLYAFENFARAVELFDHMTAMIKVEQDPRAYVAGRAIGSGIQNVLFADVRSVADAEECVRAVRAESPRTGGRYGAADRRFAGYGLDPDKNAYVQALDDVVIALMIEKDAAVRNLEAILAVKGIDMVVFGPSDYSMSLGIPGQWGDPRLREARDFVYTTALRMGVQPRAELSGTDDAKAYLDMGIRHFAINTDVYILRDFWQRHGDAMREALAGR
ncbi:MAG: 2,4-dihydroxyhept-2-ene-1,7-dioic acid aldolase [Actinobacteria bacterium]|nr:2,4-dihydroxyhept-2-ene-1,7-dioic acid aldolase [Actinomycetota bacterium]